MWATAGAVATGCCVGTAPGVGVRGTDGNGNKLPKQDAGAPGGGALAEADGVTTGGIGFGFAVKG